MEFNEKLQELRKRRGLTQEELAQALYVSRTAISKWESGRGFPNIDSLKAIAVFFSVTVDELLSGDELLTLAQQETRQKQIGLCHSVYGLLDLSVAMCCFLPLFRQIAEGEVQAVSLLALTALQPWLRWMYGVSVVVMVLIGLSLLVLPPADHSIGRRRTASLLGNGMVAFLFTLGMQPYAAVFLFLLLGIKVLLWHKGR